MFLSDGRRQNENCKSRQFSWQFTWKTTPVPQGALKRFAWGLTFMPVSVHSYWNTSPGNRLKKIAKEGDVAGEEEGKSSAAVQFKTMAGPFLPSHVNCSPFSQPGSLQNYTFPGSNSTKHSLTKWRLQISLFFIPQIPSRKADKWGSAGNTGSKAAMHLHTRPSKMFLKICRAECCPSARHPSHQLCA